MFLRVCTLIALLPCVALAATIEVPAEYSTIQDAIDAAVSGDTVLVASGYYAERVVIHTTVALIGEDKLTTTIDAGWYQSTVTIAADEAVVSGFSITGSDDDRYCAGVTCSGHNNVTIEDNLILRNRRFGIYVSDAENLQINSNTIAYNVTQGIYISSSTGCSIAGNLVFLNGEGIYVYSSSLCSLLNNQAHSCPTGIYLNWLNTASSIIIEDNLISGCSNGMRFRYVDAGGASVRNNVVFGNDRGMWTHNYAEVSFEGNYVFDNGLGMLVMSSPNSMFGNVFDNDSNVYGGIGDNIWNDIYPTGGNYFSDYTGVDEYYGENQDIPGTDGIGDTQYDIPGLSSDVDHYPLMTAPLFVMTQGPYYGIAGDPITFENRVIGGYGASHEYTWQFGDGETSGDPEPTHVYAYASDFAVELLVRDSLSNVAVDSTIAFIKESNDAPEIPGGPWGPDSVPFYASYRYSMYTIDPDNDDVYYQVDWGDDNVSDWVGPYEFQDTCYLRYAWDDLGVYDVRVRARDDWDYRSDWSDPISVEIIWVLCGDANQSGYVDIDDVVYTIAYIFTGGPPPVPWGCTGDSNGDDRTDIDDVVYLIQYIFELGPPPVEGCCVWE